MGKVIDLTGQTFGVWTVVERAPNYVSPKGVSKAAWVCRDAVGREKVVTGVALRYGSGHSRMIRQAGADPDTALRMIFSLYRTNARKRGYAFKLSFEECLLLFVQDCVYCGHPPANKRKPQQNSRAKYEPRVYQGIDRVDNSRGYEPDNVVPCCGTCNIAKRTMTQDEFLAWVERVYQHSVEGK